MTINIKLIRSELPPNKLGENLKWRTSTSCFRWKMFVYIFIFSLFTNFHIVFASQTSGNLIPKLINAIEKAANFFQDDYENINVDGLFGLQLGQGQLKEASVWLNKTNSKWKKPVQMIVDKMSRVLELTLENNLANDIEYTKMFLNLLKKPFHFQRQAQQINTYSQQIFYPNVFYDEEKGDTCFTQVLGSYVKNGRTLPKCTVTKKCLEYMMSPFASGYYITHQLLYFIFIQKIGCEGSGNLQRFAERPTIRDIQRNLCRRIYQEAKMLAKNGKVDTDHQDLFAEQSLLCAPLGYLDFLQTDWMKMIMSWQDPSGCFAEIPPLETNKYKRSSSTMRKLLREKYMRGRCLSHKSGLCYGVLTIYLNFLIQNTENKGQ